MLLYIIVIVIAHPQLFKQTKNDNTKTPRNDYCQYCHLGYYFDICSSDESEVRLLHKHPRNQICHIFNLDYTYRSFSGSYFPQPNEEFFHE